MISASSVVPYSVFVQYGISQLSRIGMVTSILLKSRLSLGRSTVTSGPETDSASLRTASRCRLGGTHSNVSLVGHFLRFALESKYQLWPVGFYLHSCDLVVWFIDQLCGTSSDVPPVRLLQPIASELLLYISLLCEFCCFPDSIFYVGVRTLLTGGSFH